MEPKITSPAYDFNTLDTITLSPYANTTIAGGGYTVTNVSTSASSYPYPNVTISSGTGISSPWGATGISLNPKIKLDGEGADIEVNGESLMGLLRDISERLRLLKPNEKLEEEWEELRVLGNKYRELEQQIKEKQATWDRLKAMPPPEID